MAVTLTEQYRIVAASGNILKVGYKVDCSGAYAAAGVVFNNTSFGSQIFSKIYGANTYLYAEDPDTNYLFAFDAPVNTSTTNPSISGHVYDQATGGVGWNEVGTGDTYAGTFYVEIWGVPVGGVDGNQL